MKVENKRRNGLIYIMDEGCHGKSRTVAQIYLFNWLVAKYNIDTYCLFFSLGLNGLYMAPVGIYLLKVNSRNTRTR